MAARATRMVLERIEDPEMRVEAVIFEPELVIRQSA
jgi:DNA-binding LacI/PurR family transcriptional regulator